MSSAERQPIQATWFIILASVMILACIRPLPSQGEPSPERPRPVAVSSTSGTLDRYFITQLTVNSDYVQKVEFKPGLVGELPPGLVWNARIGEISGTPTVAGIYSIKLYYRDAAKGTYNHPNLADDAWYFWRFAITIAQE